MEDLSISMIAGTRKGGADNTLDLEDLDSVPKSAEFSNVKPFSAAASKNNPLGHRARNVRNSPANLSRRSVLVCRLKVGRKPSKKIAALGVLRTANDSRFPQLTWSTLSLEVPQEMPELLCQFCRMALEKLLRLRLGSFWFAEQGGRLVQDHQ